MSRKTSQPLPAYVEQLRIAGGFWKRLFLQLLFRLAAKGNLGLGMNIGKMRRQQEALDVRLTPVDFSTRRRSAEAGEFDAEWVEAMDLRPERVILYLHGGAFMFRFPRTHARLAGEWCKAFNARALMVDYRLAPEHRWPAGLDDCHAAYRWLLASGVAAGNIVVAGDSAGGNLSLALLHRIKAAGEPMPACAVLLSPFVDFTLSSPSLCNNEFKDPIFTARGVVAVRSYYAEPEQFLEPGLSPLFGDYRDFPPLLFQASDTEMLRDESLRAAARAHAAGVEVRVELWQGQLPHVFQAFPRLPQSQAAVQRILAFIRQHTHWEN
ncbi:alpha/beta hydrolase [Pseudomonas sp. N040]|uniref:alpha/beta hydrolase n=1 Tax=Pseudomonas sp. N040 TaxID=2785325 RepID=UPI0018A2B752|nr:alpha/beta hydrolase [Pseudomonas sp. N040]MBF7729926.1 alpha/beta hydrolase [Pseudomonas sp. N040]MBW7013568.1 alpha/beta hydrolase [Pseudomonas sp. N040]